MKSCLGLLLALTLMTLVIGGGALIWYLSDTSEFSRQAKVPVAIPVKAPGNTPAKPPVAIPVRPQPRR